MAVDWIQDAQRFTAICDEWDRLAERHALPFLRHAWFAAWWEAFGGRRRLRICALRQDGELAALFPLCARAGRLEAMANAHTPVFHPLARDEAALRLVIEAAVEAAGEELRVPALPVAHPAVDLLTEASLRGRRITLVEPQNTSPIVDTTGTFEDYRRRMQRGDRRDLERRRRQMEREHQAAFELVQDGAGLEPALRRGLAVEASGWKGKRGTAILFSPETETFYRLLADRFAAAGRAGLSSLSLDGSMAAFDLWLLDHGRLWILKGGYEEAFRRYSPGLALTYAEVELCFAFGLCALELLGDPDPWKLKFSTSERRHCSFHSYRRRPIPAARYAYRRLVRPLLKRAYKRVRSR